MKTDTGEMSDGYHTFNELYEQRTILYLALAYLVANQNHEGQVWRARYHSDGTMFNGMFILGINQKKGKQITFHLDIKYWDYCDWASTLETAPEWDRHTPKDVLDRIKKIFLKG